MVALECLRESPVESEELSSLREHVVRLESSKQASVTQMEQLQSERDRVQAECITHSEQQTRLEREIDRLRSDAGQTKELEMQKASLLEKLASMERERVTSNADSDKYRGSLEATRNELEKVNTNAGLIYYFEWPLHPFEFK